MNEKNSQIRKVSEPVFVLVEPQLGQNIGAAARAMWNFGLTRLRLVAPRDGWPNQDAVATASGAGFLLDNATLHLNLADAVGDCNQVFAATARQRSLTKRVMSPVDTMTRTRELVSSGLRVAIVLGPERSGLTSDQVAYADALISVPTNPQFSSLNLAQCALLLAYEWKRSDTLEEHAIESAQSVPAESHVKGKFVDLLLQDLQQTEHFWPAEKADGMQLNLRNLIMRLDLTVADIQTLHGVRRSLMNYRGESGRVRGRVKKEGSA